MSCGFIGRVRTQRFGYDEGEARAQTEALEGGLSPLGHRWCLFGNDGRRIGKRCNRHVFPEPREDISSRR